MVWNFRNKEFNINQTENYLLCRSLNMFKWEGLPDSIPEGELEKLLQTTGKVFITEYNGELVALDGTLTGNRDVYGNYKSIIVTNPYVNLNKTYALNDGVMGYNDSLKTGLKYIYSKYSTLLNESEISLMLGVINTRIQSLISASDDSTVTSAKKFLTDIEGGSLGVISENKLFDSLKVSNTGDNRSLKELIEIHQYIKSNMFNEIGLHSNPNMKKERLIEGELTDGDDNIYPFIDNMYRYRVKLANDLNIKYNVNITVEFDSVWMDSPPEPEKEKKGVGLFKNFIK